MSTYHEPKMIVGNFLSDIDPTYVGVEDVLEYLESEHEMLWVEEEDWIGFPVEEVLDISFATANMLQKRAKEFKKITGLSAKVASCVYSY